jgi:hypothetical protein
MLMKVPIVPSIVGAGPEMAPTVNPMPYATVDKKAQSDKKQVTTLFNGDTDFPISGKKNTEHGVLAGDSE